MYMECGLAENVCLEKSERSYEPPSQILISISSTGRVMSTMKISSRLDKSLSREFENLLKARFVLVVLHTVIVRLLLRCRIVGAHLHFVRYYGQRPSLRRRFSQRYDWHRRGSIR